MAELTILNNPQTEETIRVTPKAIEEIRRIMAQNNIPESHGLRVGVKGGGCSGFTYVLGFDDKTREGDVVLEFDGVNVFIDPRSLQFIGGTELDFTDGLSGRGFVFNNPHAQKTCGCGNSFSV